MSPADHIGKRERELCLFDSSGLTFRISIAYYRFMTPRQEEKEAMKEIPKEQVERVRQGQHREADCKNVQPKKVV